MDAFDDDWTGAEMLDDEGVEEIDHALSVVLAGDRSGAAEEVGALFTRVTDSLSASEAESIGSALRTIGRWASDRKELGALAGKALPVAGAAVGTVYGGPVGAAIGKRVGEQAGRALGGNRAQVPPATTAAADPQPSGAAAPAGSPAAAAAAPGGLSSAPAQLLYLVQNPAFLSSLVSLALGSEGRATVPLGDGKTEVPAGAFVNLASHLAGQAAQHAEALLGDEEGAMASDAYLRTADGGFGWDPAVPEQRAAALLTLLRQDDESLLEMSGLYGEAEDEGEDDEAWDEDWDEDWEEWDQD